MSYPPFSPGLVSMKALFDMHPDYQRMTFFAQDGHLINDYKAHKPEKLRVAILDRQGKNRILTKQQAGTIIRPNGMVPCCIFGRERRDYVVKWDERICFSYDGIFKNTWVMYHGPYNRQADRMDWFKRALLWTPKREGALRSGGKTDDNWEAYEEIRAREGRRIE